jgi:hypothetical protein
MTGVRKAFLLSGLAERLAGARARPNRSTPAGKVEGVGPSTDPGEEVALVETGEV